MFCVKPIWIASFILISQRAAPNEKTSLPRGYLSLFTLFAHLSFFCLFVFFFTCSQNHHFFFAGFIGDHQLVSSHFSLQCEINSF